MSKYRIVVVDDIEYGVSIDDGTRPSPKSKLGKGGAGSGNFGHAGIPGVRGGSAGRGGAISSFESAIKGQSVETAGVFDANGNLLFQKSGGEFGVGDFTPEEQEQLKGATLTHNHPSGGSFSEKDVQTLLEYDVKEVRAVGDKYTYSISVPEGTEPDVDTVMDSYKEIYAERSMERYEQTPDQKIDFVEWQHNVMTEIAETNNLNYERESS